MAIREIIYACPQCGAHRSVMMPESAVRANMHKRHDNSDRPCPGCLRTNAEWRVVTADDGEPMGSTGGGRGGGAMYVHEQKGYIQHPDFDPYTTEEPEF